MRLWGIQLPVQQRSRGEAAMSNYSTQTPPCRNLNGCDPPLFCFCDSPKAAAKRTVVGSVFDNEVECHSCGKVGPAPGWEDDLCGACKERGL